jgi:hypothetical protein
MLSKCIRHFASKHPKGNIGKQGSMASNFSFPRHKELFTEHFYEGEEHPGDDGTQETF